MGQVKQTICVLCQPRWIHTGEHGMVTRHKNDAGIFNFCLIGILIKFPSSWPAYYIFTLTDVNLHLNICCFIALNCCIKLL